MLIQCIFYILNLWCHQYKCTCLPTWQRAVWIGAHRLQAGLRAPAHGEVLDLCLGIDLSQNQNRMLLNQFVYGHRCNLRHSLIPILFWYLGFHTLLTFDLIPLRGNKSKKVGGGCEPSHVWKHFPCSSKSINQLETSKPTCCSKIWHQIDWCLKAVKSSQGSRLGR